VSKGRPIADKDGHRWETDVAAIEIEDAWTDALDGVDGFSHLWVIWWLSRFTEPPQQTRVRPQGRSDMPLLGIFATRSPHRPNPIAITAVRLLGREGNLLTVEGLDAEVGTPVLDLKPYLGRGDLIPDATMPDWIERLWRIHDAEREV
jgi:tRNA-Thr(GGU) m(6)t(6)A37 methyltransferase TsaA